MAERKRVTLHPILSDGSVDLDTNLYPKTFLDGIVDREGNEVTVATAEELDEKANKVDTKIVGAQTYSYNLSVDNGLVLSHKSKNNISRSTVYQLGAILNTFNKPGTQEENRLFFPSTTGTIAIKENTLVSSNPDYEYTVDDAYTEYGSCFILSGEIIVKLYPLDNHEDYYNIFVWRKEGYAAILDVNGGYNFIQTIEDATYTEYADKQNYLSKAQGSRVWEMSDNFYSPEAYTSEMKPGDIIIDIDTENLAIIRNIYFQNNQLQVLTMYGFGSSDKPTRYSYESGYDFIEAEEVGGGTQLYKHYVTLKLKPAGMIGTTYTYDLILINNDRNRIVNQGSSYFGEHPCVAQYVQDQGMWLAIGAYSNFALSGMSGEGNFMIFDATVSGNVSVISWDCETEGNFVLNESSAPSKY